MRYALVAVNKAFVWEVMFSNFGTVTSKIFIVSTIALNIIQRDLSCIAIGNMLTLFLTGELLLSAKLLFISYLLFCFFQSLTVHNGNNCFQCEFANLLFMCSTWIYIMKSS